MFSKNKNRSSEIKFKLIDNPSQKLNETDRIILKNDILNLVKSSWGDYEENKINDVFLRLDQIVLGYLFGSLCFISGGKWENTSYNGKKIPTYRVGLTVVRKFNKGEYLWEKGIMGKGVFLLLWNAFKRKYFRTFYVAYRTLEPTTYYSTVKNFSRVFPSIDKTISPNEEEKAVAIQLAKIINPTCRFDVENFVIRKAFSKNLSLAESKKDHVEHFKNERVKDFFLKNLSYDEGDAFIVLAEMNIFSVLKRGIKLFAKGSPRNSFSSQ